MRCVVLVVVSGGGNNALQWWCWVSVYCSAIVCLIGSDARTGHKPSGCQVCVMTSDELYQQDNYRRIGTQQHPGCCCQHAGVVQFLVWAVG